MHISFCIRSIRAVLVVVSGLALLSLSQSAPTMTSTSTLATATSIHSTVPTSIPLDRSTPAPAVSPSSSISTISKQDASTPQESNSDHHAPISNQKYFTIVALILVLVILGGIFAGLTIGLMSLDTTNLAILKKSGTPTEQAYAARIEPIRRDTHMLLVTLLLSNTVINETLPILFDAIHLEGYQAVLFSAVLIVIFGEIIPQAVCARYGLRIGAFFAWPVRILMWIMWIIAFPIAKLLDFVLGHNDGVTYRRAELRELVALHGEDQSGPLCKHEVSVLRAVLELRDKTVTQIMTNLDDIFMLSYEARLDRPLLNQILMAGHSRVPVYSGDRNNIVGVVLIKELILNDPDDNTPISALKIRKLPRVQQDMPLFDMLRVFQTGGSHMAIVLEQTSYDDPNARHHVRSSRHDMARTQSRRRTNRLSQQIKSDKNATLVESNPQEENGLLNDPVLHDGKHSLGQQLFPFKTIGIVTLEDVIEELLGEEIIDETDVFVDVKTKVRVTHQFKELRKDKDHLDDGRWFDWTGSISRINKSPDNGKFEST